MNSNPLVSIHMVTYNQEKYIAQAIESALMQKTEFNFEIVIGEDCSGDGTAEIVMDYALKYPHKIKALINAENLGFGGAINSLKTFQACRGKYIAICEGDDYWTDPNKLQKQIDFLENNGEYVCHCHNAQVIQNNKFVRLYNDFLTDRILTTDDLVSTFSIPTASVVYRNCLQPIPDYLMKFSLDIILYFALSKFGKFYQSTDVMCAYRFHEGGSWTGQDAITKMNENLKIKQYYLDEMPLTPKQRNLVIQLVVGTRLNRLKYFSNTEFLGINYFRDFAFLIFKRMAGFKFSAKFFIFCMIPDGIINRINKNRTSQA